MFQVLKHTESVLWHITLWILTALPDISNLILVLVGVIMSLPKLAERVEDNPKTRYGVAVICIALGLAGFVVSVNQRRQADARMGDLITNVNILVKDAGTLVTNTNNLVTTLTFLVPQVASEDARIADLNVKIEAAKEKHNPNVIADLQARADAAQKAASETAKAFAITLLPNVTRQIDNAETIYRNGGLSLYEKYHYQSKLPPDQRQREEAQEQAKLRARYEDDLRTLAPTAAYLRQQLLTGLPETEADKRMDAAFTKAAGGDITGFTGRDVIFYLYDLLKRFAPPAPAPPTAISGEVN
jgi:hypothetical protein